jgi:hypothetical protein
MQRLLVIMTKSKPQEDSCLLLTDAALRILLSSGKVAGLPVPDCTYTCPVTLGVLFYSEDGGRPFLRNDGKYLPDYMALHPIRRYLS